jgi:hypothetical protein
MTTTTSPPVVSRKGTGRTYLWLGLALGLAGPLLLVAQLQAKRLINPWYLPILGTIGAVLVGLALARRRGIGRSLALVLLGLLATGEWFILMSMSKLPPYTGPVAIGRPFPAFSTTLADGSSFTQASLQGEQKTAMVFFRGRW